MSEEVPNDQPSSDTQASWTSVAKSSALEEGSALEVLVGEQIVALFRSSGVLYAIDGMCAHQGGPLAEGHIADGCVTCPWHGWQYELATGIQTINRQPLQRTFPVREIDGQIQIEL